MRVADAHWTSWSFPTKTDHAMTIENIDDEVDPPLGRSLRPDGLKLPRQRPDDDDDDKIHNSRGEARV
jgi:hypothetical protein